MFFTSTLLPTGSGSPCDSDCSGNWFGWTSPIGFPGRWELGGFSGVGGPLNGIRGLGTAIQVGHDFDPNGYYGEQFSFSGGRYQDKYVSAQLAPGRWRIFAAWSSSSVPQTETRTSIFLWNTLSLVDRNENFIKQITLLKTNQFGSGLNPPVNDGGRGGGVDMLVGGLDGCGHLYASAVQPDGVAMIMGNEIVIPRSQEAYLKAVPGDVAGAGVSQDFGAYIVSGFYMDGCRCGGFLDSSLRWA